MGIIIWGWTCHWGFKFLCPLWSPYGGVCGHMQWWYSVILIFVFLRKQIEFCETHWKLTTFHCSSAIAKSIEHTIYVIVYYFAEQYLYVLSSISGWIAVTYIFYVFNTFVIKRLFFLTTWVPVLKWHMVLMATVGPNRGIGCLPMGPDAFIDSFML